MSGILRLESLTKGNTLKQGDKTPLKYRLFDADGEQLSIAGKPAKVRLVYPDFLTIGYEKGGLIVAQDDTVTFTIDSVIPSRIYHVEIIVDDKFIFPSRADETKFTVDKSSLGAETNIIEIVGKDVLIREVKEQIDSELEPFLGEIEQAELDRQAQEEARETAEGEREGAESTREANEQTRLNKDSLRDDKIAQMEADKDAVIANATVDSEVILARGGKATLGERLDETTAQLAQKANKAEVRKIDVPITLNDADAELLSAIEGGEGTTFNLLSVPKNHSVSHEKTTFLRVGSNNLMDVSLFTEGFRIDEFGEVIEDERFSYSDLISVKPNDDYFVNNGPQRVLFYKEDGEFISSINGERSTFWTFSTPELAKYVRLLIRTSLLNESTQMGEGLEEKGVDEYFEELHNVKVDGDLLKDRSVTGDKIEYKTIDDSKVSFIENSSNLFNIDTVTEGRISNEGEFEDNVQYVHSDYIEVTPNTYYTSKLVSSIPVYDIHKNFLIRFGVSSANFEENIFEIPTEGHFIRININTRKAIVSEVQVNEGEELLPYEHYYKKLKEDIEVTGATGTGEKTVYIHTPDNSISYYGIEGNGVSDDTQGFRNYLSDLKANGGGEMFVPHGTYILTGTLEIPSNVTVRGQGDSTLFKLGDNHDLAVRQFRRVGFLDSRPYFLTEEGSENVFFKDFKVEGNRNTSEDAMHHAIAFMDTSDGGMSNVSTGYINFDPERAKNAGLMGFNVVFARAKRMNMFGGKHEYGGYENVGLEFSEDIVIDSIYSGLGWRTSFQIHQGNKNIKLVNSNVCQDYNEAHAGLTIHGRTRGENEDILLANNTLKSITNPFGGQARDHLGGLQMLGPTKSITIANNNIHSNKNGIYLPNNSNWSESATGRHIITGNKIHSDTGVSLFVSGKALVDNNFVSSGGDRIYETEAGAEVKLGENFGF